MRDTISEGAQDTESSGLMAAGGCSTTSGAACSVAGGRVEVLVGGGRVETREGSGGFREATDCLRRDVADGVHDPVQIRTVDFLGEYFSVAGPQAFERVEVADVGRRDDP